jgi:hypothetical protein
MDQAYMQICAPACESMVGGSFRIDHLTSQKGLTLNGKTCRVIKFTPNPTKNPELRLQCKLDEGGPPILLKGTNLVRVEANIMRSLMEGSSAPLPDDRIIAGLRLALEEHATNPPDIRRDLNHRIKLYRRLLKKLENARGTEGNALANEQYCFPCGATYVHDGEFEDSLDYILTMSRPACVGNNQVDTRFMDLGLKGNGIATCNICTELVETDSSSGEVLVTLPCVHMFHESCLREWLQSDIGRMNWNCPTCRHPVPHNLSTYHVNYDAQLCNRFKEFLLSGFCPSCILWVMEKDRNQVTPAAVNDRGERMTMGCVGQMQTGKVFICPPKRSK